MKTLKIILGVLFVVILGIFTWSYFYMSSPNVYEKGKKLFGASQHKVDNTINKLGFLKTIQRQFNPINPNDVFNLVLSQKDIEENKKDIDFFLSAPEKFIRDEWKKWRSAELQVGDSQKFEVKYKFHGSSLIPYMHNTFSLKIKHGKESKYLENKRRYNLIAGEEMGIKVIASNKLAKQYGLMAPAGRMVLLKLNGKVKGDFYFVEELSKESLERDYQITEYAIFRCNDDWDRKQGVGHTSDLDLDYQNMEVDGQSSSLETAFGRYKNFLEAIKTNDIEEVKTYIDLDYMAKFLAVAYFNNNSHFVSGDNARYIYNYASGKFFPIYRQESELIPYAETKIVDYNKNFFNSHAVKGWENNLSHRVFKMLVADDAVREMRDKYLLDIVNNQQGIIRHYDDVYNNAKLTYIHSPGVNMFELKNSYEATKINVNNNIEIIRKYLNYGKVFITLSRSGSETKASIINDSYSNLRLIAHNKFGEVVKPTDSMELLPSIRLEYETEFNQVHPEITKNYITDGDITFTAINTLTGDTFSKYNVYVNKIQEIKVVTEEQTASSLGANNIKYRLENKSFTISQGNYTVSSNIVFPKDYSVKILPNTSFKMLPKVSILVQGNFTAKGQKSGGISFEKASAEPFGVVAVQGDKTTEVNLRYVTVNGGSSAFLQGMHFLGQISTYNVSLSMSNCKYSNSSSDDGYNAKYCTLKVDSCEFYNNSYDQLDADYCTGYITNSLFVGTKDTKKLDNGDGLDISGSLARVENCTFTKCTDKGISFGEAATVYIKNNTIKDNTTAVAIKDNCKVYSDQNILENNSKDWLLYIKKSFYLPPALYMYEKAVKDRVQVTDGEYKVLTKQEFSEIINRIFTI